MTWSELLKGEGAAGGRSPADVTSLLVELGRALKARQFYDADDPRLVPLLGQAVRAWQADLARHGPLEIEVGATGIRVPALGLKVSSVQVGGLLQCLAQRGARSLHFDAALESEAFAALIDLLAGEADEIERERGIEHALYRRAPTGLVMNRLEPERALPPRSQAAPGERPPAAAAAPEVTPIPTTALSREEPKVGASPPASSPQLGEVDPPTDHREAPPVDPVLAAPTPPAEATLPELECDPADTVLELETDDEAPPRPAPEPLPEVDDAAPSPAVAASPSDVPGDDSREIQARHVMQELGECEDDLKYNDLSRRLEMLASALSDEGDVDLGFQAMELLAQHTGDEAKRSARQRQLAQEQLASLVQGPRLQALIQRACAPGESSITASQVLLQLGSQVVPTLFDAAEHEEDANRRGQMHGILIAMSDAAVPELLRAMDDPSPATARSAVRLAGEMQNPGTVQRLSELLAGSDAALRQEAAKALVRVGDPHSIEVLVQSLQSPIADVPSLAAFCLGAAGTRPAAEALLAALDDAVSGNDFPFAVEVIRALGRLGRAEATPALADLLLRRTLRRRRQFRDLKLAATAALGRLPGDDAVGALAQAAQSRDPQLRRAAQTALDRRAHALR